MELSQAGFLGLVVVAAAARLAELRRSKANQRSLLAQGASLVADPNYRWMVLLHSGWLAGSGLEVILADRPFLPWLGFPALFFFLASNGICYWAIRSPSYHWNTQVVNSTGLGIIAKGPYRWMRHPNYAAVFFELAALPLMHTAFMTAALATVLHIPAPARRIRTERGAADVERRVQEGNGEQIKVSAVTDVLIAGGGPAGSSLAILLAKAGLRVELHDRARFPREKVCGEGLMPAGVAALGRLGVTVEGRPFRGVRYHCGELSVEGEFPGSAGTPAMGLGIRRYRLDRALWQAAAAADGVRAFEGSEIEAVITEAGRVVGARTTAGERRARLLVAADGVHSRIRRQLGLDCAGKRDRSGIRRHFQLAEGKEPPEWVDVYLGGHSEVYVTPVGQSEIQVAVLASKEVRKDDYARVIAGHRRLAALLEGASPSSELAGMHPLSGAARKGFAPGCVLLGDAAGFMDPVTGGGMTQALMSSDLLAGSLAGRFPPAEADLEEFERKRRKMLADYRRLTAIVLGLAARPMVAASMIRLMRLWPALFSHAIGVSGGIRRLIPGLPA